VYKGDSERKMKFVIFLIAGIFLLIGSTTFPTALNALFLLIVIVTAIAMIADQIGGKKK
jgi:hypothetical protein